MARYIPPKQSKIGQVIDVIVLLALVDNGSCIVKGALLRNPFTWGPLRAARSLSATA